MDEKLVFQSNLGRCEIKCDEEAVQDAVKKEIAQAFAEYRSFPFFPDKGVIHSIRSGTSLQALNNRFIEIKNDIFNTISDQTSTVKNRLLSNIHLTSKVVTAIGIVHQALGELNNSPLERRRFTLITEKSGAPTIYHRSDSEMVLAHIGLGPVWKEIPTIYLGLNLFDVIASEKMKGEGDSYEAFKTLLLIEERAIETGFTHVEALSQATKKTIERLLDELLWVSIPAAIPLEKPPEKRKPRRLSPQTRLSLLNLLDARFPWDETVFNYEKNMKGIKNLERLARRYKKGEDYYSLREIVRLLVAASGHDIHEVRNRANILLERIFAPKEFNSPLATNFININQGMTHTLHFDLPKSRSGYFIRLYSTNPYHDFTLEKDIDYEDIDLSYDDITGTYTASRCFEEIGSYDYVVFKKMRRGAQWTGGKDCSGRINIIPDVRGEIVLEIFPDIHGHTRVYWDDKSHPGLVYNENGEVIRLGRFSDITVHLEDLRRRYFITALYLLGVQRRGSNREDWAPEATSPSPFSPVSLIEIEPSLGGEKEFNELVHKAHELGIKIIVDMVPHVNRKSTAVPDEWVIKCYNEGGNLVERASTDGRYGSWNDGKLLNYRKFEVWEFITDSILTFIDKYDIDGIRFDSAHAVPIMMKRNNYPLIYGKERSHEDMVQGTIIVNDREDEHFITTGFYDSACRDIIANPLHYYIMMAIERKLRDKKKNFFINIAECYWGRERVLTRSGIIPYNSALFKICENIIHGKVDVREIYHLYDNYYPKALPPGTELLGILGNHDERRALNTFGKLGLRAAAMLTSFMSNIIMDYEGSAEGEDWKVYLDNIYVNWNQFESVANRSMEGFYRKLYSFHRKNRGKGYLIWTNNHTAAAAMKFTENLIMIGTFNFSDSTQTVWLQFDNPVLPIDDCEYYRITDPVYSPVTGKYDYYTGKELRISKLQTVVPYTDRVKILLLTRVENPKTLYREFLKESFLRLISISDISHFNSNYSFLEIASHADSYDNFSAFITDHLVPLFNNNDGFTLELGLKRTLFHLFRSNIKSGKEILEYIENLSKSDNDTLKELGGNLKLHNKRGSLVFISAEAEPFSKIGGLANVVYELPKELARLGEEVYVITPFYPHGDAKSTEKMKNALRKYKVSYTGINVRLKIQESEYEVGVHRGEVDGIHFFLLDHYEFFDGLYWGYTAEEKLRKRIAFSRACAEVIVSLGLFPLFTFTNDAFAGIFNGIVKGDHVYRDNPNFMRTSFIHIIHNVGWQYFDSYYRHEREFDHFNLFNLPHHFAEDFLDPVHGEKINCMAAGVRFADRVITVSPSYAEQIQIASDGLEHLLDHVKGINNAIGRDFLFRIQHRFKSSGFVEKNYPLFLQKVHNNKLLRDKIKARYPELLEGSHYCESVHDKTRKSILTRMRNKLLLQTQEGLVVDPDRILFSMIHRIVDQKGFQLLLEASEGVFRNLGFQGIIGGPVPSGDQRGEELARGLLQLKNHHSDSVSVTIGFLDVTTALLASDVFLMPSLYEPGGISQLEAFACGCLVVARATGGLRDTVHPLRIKGCYIEGNGFLFTDYTPASFYDAMARCSTFFKKVDEKTLHKARCKARDSVYYWGRSAKEYIKEIYTLKEIIRVI